MSDRERAREIVGNGLHGTTVSHERRLYLQDAIATALAQARAEGQEAMTVAEIERTIANEALRRAAEAVEQRAVEVGRQECCGHGVGYGEHQECCGSPDFVITDRDAATAIRDLIKEPGHE